MKFLVPSLIMFLTLSAYAVDKKIAVCYSKATTNGTRLGVSIFDYDGDETRATIFVSGGRFGNRMIGNYSPVDTQGGLYSAPDFKLIPHTRGLSQLSYRTAEGKLNSVLVKCD